MAQGTVPEAAWVAVALAAAIGDGTAVLDVGCGTGGFCAWAAARGARVAGADADAVRIAIARRAVPAGDIRAAPMEHLPWADGAFDVVTGFNAFQYATDIEAALAEARRVARTPGAVAVCKWGPPAANEFFAFLARLEPERFTLHRPEVRDPVDAALQRLGIPVADAGEVATAITMGSAPELTTALATAGSHAAPEHVLAAAAPFRRPDGSYRFENRLVYRILRA